MLFISAGTLPHAIGQTTATQPAAPAPAQTQNSTNNAPQPPDEQQKTDEQKKTDENAAILKKEQSQRILSVIPNFGTTNRRTPPPLTPEQKFHLFAKSAFDPVELAVTGMQAAISQGNDEFPEYGQGAAGYGKRYGATLADEVSSGFFTDYFYPVIFKQDPRYYRLGEGSVGRRLVYALKQEVICHNDHGRHSPSWENAFGALTSGGLSNIYYPPSDRGFGLTMSRTGISAAYGTLAGVVDEFYPDIHHWLFHRHEPMPAPAEQ